MRLNDLPWQQACCAWHGQYVEAPMRAGGVVRIRRTVDEGGEHAYEICRFGADNKALDTDAQTGEPAYVAASAPEVLALL